MARLNQDGTVDYSDYRYQPPDPTQQPPPDPSGGTTITPGQNGLPKSGPPETNPFPDPVPTPQTVQKQKPTGGNIMDPAYMDSLLAYYGQQPGVNPSVTNDPTYWKGRVASGAFGTDENYLIQRFFQPEGPPEGASVAPAAPAAPAASAAPAAPGAGPIQTGIPTDSSPLSSFLTQLLQQQAAQQSTVNTQRQGVLDQIKGLASKYAQPVTADDPTIANSTNAYTGQVNRSIADYKQQAAERAYAEGVPSGAFDSQIGNAVLSGGRSVGDFQSTLMTNELQSRRQALSDVLTQSGNLLSAQDASDIQNKIAAIDSSLNEQSLNLQDKASTNTTNLGYAGLDLSKLLGLSSLDLQRLLGTGSLDLQRLLGTGSLANQQTSIGNQNNQFYDELGLQSAQATKDDALIAQLLGQ